MNITFRSLTGLLAASGAVFSLACVPSIPPCDCGADGTGSGGGVWPDETQLDRSAEAEVVLHVLDVSRDEDVSSNRYVFTAV